jgi:flagellar hook-associated protein 3 FlgL
MNRVTDASVSAHYVNSINRLKGSISLLQRQIASGNAIEKPSDSPSKSVILIRNNDVINQINTNLNNIKTGLSFLNQTVFSLEVIQSEMMNVIGKLADIEDPLKQKNLNNYADQIDQSLKIILDVANSKADGKYVFGGTDLSDAPFKLSADNQVVLQNPKSTGHINAKVSSGIKEKINLTGVEVFGTILKGNGAFNKNASVGTTTTITQNVYDSFGNQYNFQMNFEKVDNQKYQLTYNLVDSGNNVIHTSSSPQLLEFDQKTGYLLTLNGKKPSEINISVPNNNINFFIDFQNLIESNTNSVSFELNQQMDIFNLLKNISRNLRNGILPTDEQKSQVDRFHQRVLEKLSEIGNIINQFNSFENMLNQQSLEIQAINQEVGGVDVVKSIIDLQNKDYLLQVTQKIAASILPKSLLDYL